MGAASFEKGAASSTPTILSQVGHFDLKTSTNDTSFDLIISGGVVLDGTGNTPYPADVGVIGGKITAIGDLSAAVSSQTINAYDLHVAPGFIDIHTHSDISAHFSADQKSALGMGVTTQVAGNCSLSMALVQDTETFSFEKRWLAPYNARVRWNSFSANPITRLRRVPLPTSVKKFVPIPASST